MPYKVAIIIPTLNEELHIERCIESVRWQTFPFVEMDVMVVDGGSTDRTREIVQGLHEQYSNIRLLHNPKRIQSAAFNIGVASSEAPYVIRLDAHAEYNDRYVELCLLYLRTNDKVGDVGGIWNIRPQHKGLIPETNAIINQSRFGIGGAAFRVGATAGYVDTVPFGAYPRRVIEEVGGMREDLPRGEDNEYVTRIKRAGYKIFLDPAIVCTYYSRPTIRTFLKQKYNDGFSIGHLFHVDRQAISLRHIVPLLFVLTIIIGLIGGLVWNPLWWLLLTGLSVYAMCAIIATISMCCKFGAKYMLTLPWMFFATHITYGIGTIVGLLKKQ